MNDEDDALRAKLLQILEETDPPGVTISKLRAFQQQVARANIPTRRKTFHNQAATEEINKRMSSAIGRFAATFISDKFDATQAASAEKTTPSLVSEEASEARHSRPIDVPTHPISEALSTEHLVYTDLSQEKVSVSTVVESVRIMGCRDSTFRFPAVKSSISLENVFNCEISACCRQLRLTNCQNLTLFVSVQTPPICEGCSALTICEPDEPDEHDTSMLNDANMSLKWGAGFNPVFLDVPPAKAKELYNIKKQIV